KADRLVYVDVVEHMILHALIAFETNHEFGIDGYVDHLAPRVLGWYVEDRPQTAKEKREHSTKPRKKKAFLKPLDALEILSVTEAIINISKPKEETHA
ncbi:hypothetical protein, partial [Herbiconiux daphne]